MVTNSKTRVDEYWSGHTVRTKHFKSEQESEKYSEWRLKEYPCYEKLMSLNAHHDDEVVMDYGCGPGNDLVHFIKTGAKKIIGVDISEKALKFAKHRTSLYTDNVIPIEFIKTTDDTKIVSLENDSLDHIICSGVLHHVSHPLLILKEFFRLLKSDSNARVMVYNRNSIWFHVYVAHDLGGGFPTPDVDEVFRKSTDGVNCPISKAYNPNEFIRLCCDAGFETKFVGGYFSQKDIAIFNKLKNEKYRSSVLNKPDFGEKHKEFIRAVEVNSKGYPTYNEKYCGIGGVYALHKR